MACLVLIVVLAFPPVAAGAAIPLLALLPARVPRTAFASRGVLILADNKTGVRRDGEYGTVG